MKLLLKEPSAFTLLAQCSSPSAVPNSVDFEKSGPRTIWIDCDVTKANGGTRTATVSVGYYEGKLIIDLDYEHDSQADTDMNVI